MNTVPFYLMESLEEGERLRMKGDAESTLDQLLRTNLDRLPAPEPNIVEAGAGVGFVSKIITNVLISNYPRAHLSLLDCSSDRLNQAKETVGHSERVSHSYVQCNVTRIPLESNCADYVFSRFLFEYLSDPKNAFTELLRIVKPGGKLVIGDLDSNCLIHYPIEADLESNLQEISRALQELKIFDPHIGRKLYSFFHAAGMEAIRVHLSAHHLFYGDLRTEDDLNWTAKIDQLIALEHSGKLKLNFDLRQFKTRFMEMLRSQGRFTYTPIILVEGIKRHE